MNPVTINFGSSVFRFNESFDGGFCPMEATFSGVATLFESASGHYDSVSDAKAEFGAILGASINKCVQEITMKAAMNSESLMEKIGSGTPLKDAVEKDFAESGDTVYLEDFKFEVKRSRLKCSKR